MSEFCDRFGLVAEVKANFYLLRDYAISEFYDLLEITIKTMNTKL